MSTRGDMQDDVQEEPIPAERLAEAGVWIARLHAGDRDQATIAAVRQWLQASVMNARAFELSTDVWEESQNLRRIMPFAVNAPEPQGRRGPLGLAALVATAAVLAAVLFGIVLFQRAGVSTGVGEQRLLTLADGTRVFLNTATRVIVSYDRSVRKVELKSGEALFDVAKRADWPFVVQAGARQVKALGTSFVVRREGQQLAVTLVEGRVTVGPNTQLQAPQRVGEAAPGTAGAGEVFTLTPGQRLTFAADKAARLDTPSLDKTMAWRRGQVVLDDTSLSSAVAEMNRYNAVKLVVERPEAEALLVSGLFQVGDSASFAKAVAQTYGLGVIERQDEIILSGTPLPQARPSP